MSRIVLFVADAEPDHPGLFGWMARYEGDAEVVSIFGTDILPTPYLATFNGIAWREADLVRATIARAYPGTQVVVADTPPACPSCGKRYDRMGQHGQRQRMMNGHMGHTEMDPVTGATVLLDEGA